MAKAKKKEKKKGGISLNLVLIFQLIIMLGLVLTITNIISSRTRANSDAHLNMTTEERAQVILNYVEVSERQLKDFSRAAQVTELLEDPENEEKLQAAQKLARDFHLDIPYIEGLYISKWDTTVLVHSTMMGAIGKPTRSGDELILLQEAMKNSGKQVYNGGIMRSPASDKQVISMYKAVYDSLGKPIGLVGIGIETDGLITTLDRISGANKNAADKEVKAKQAQSALTNAFYYMIKADSGNILFNGQDKGKIDVPVEVDELKKLCDKYGATNTDATGKIEYTDGGKDYVASYVYIAKYDWLFTVNVAKSDIYSLTYAMRMFLGAFGAIIIVLTTVFFFINKRQERINQKLVSTIAKNAQTRQSLNTAMFKDVLTNANNRVSFSMDMEKSDVSADKPCYFMMFNILGFSEINTRYGNDAGDRLLVRTVETLNDIFPDRAVYRTGSDEFVVMIPTENGQPAPEQVLNDVNTAFRQLMVPEKIDNMGAIYPKFKIAVIKRSSAADTSVVSALKDMTNRTGEATYGMIDYREM